MANTRFGSFQSMRQMEADIREAIATGDRDALDSLRTQLQVFGMNTEMLPPDLQSQMIDMDPLEHPELRNVLVPPEDWVEEY